MDSRAAVKRAAKPFNISGYDCQTEITPDCIRRLYKMEDFVPTPHPKNKLGVSGYLQEYANKKDLATFLKKYAPKFAKDQFKFVSIENATNPQNDTADDSAEANLDVQYAIGLSNADAIFYGTPGHGPLVPDLDIPKPSKDDTEPYLDQLHYLLSLPNDELPSVLSTSYGEDEQALPKDYTDSVCHGFAKLGARGVSIIFSSGDAGPGQTCQTNDGRNQTRFNPTFPGACPYVTSVGGTHQVAPEEAATFSSGGFSD
ncbi:vesicle formation at the endoplasmic reticulum, partial [Ascosphaera atra]